MKGYLNYKMYDDTINIYNEIINKNKFILNKHFFRLIVIAYIEKQRIINDKHIKLKYHKLIMNDIPIKMKKYGIKLDYKCWNSLLESLLIQYGNNQIDRVINFFENNINNYGYWHFNKNKYNCNMKMIDLHGYHQPLIAIFILRYLFHYKINEIDINNNLYICVGRGLHRKNKTNIGLANLIIDELNKWEPKLNTYFDEINKGILIVNKNDLNQWLNINKNKKYQEKFAIVRNL